MGTDFEHGSPITDPTAGSSNGNGHHPAETATAATDRASRPIRKDERVVSGRGLYIESWLPERRSRRKPLYMLHGELGGSWLWQRYLGYFAPRGWEGHALNLRGHYWSETADFADLNFDTYVEDVLAGADLMPRPPIVIGHGMGGLLALKMAQERPVSGVILLSPALPAALLPPPPPHMIRLLPREYRRELLDWDGPIDALQRQNPDLTNADVMRVQHMMGAESGAARRQMLEGVSVDLDQLPQVPKLVVGAGLDRFFPDADSARLAEWLGADHVSFNANSHYGLIIGERSYEPVADTIRNFIETHRL
jgi:pimeloyl-ACP methyl ester carboxylesterase